MKNRYLILIVVISAITLTVSAYFMFADRGPQRFVWSESYYRTDKNPYGLFYLYRSISKSLSPGEFVVINSSIARELKPIDKPALYLFIGRNFFTDPLDIAALRHFVSSGNHAFISLVNFESHYEFGEELSEVFPELEALCSKPFTDSTINPAFTNHPTLDEFLIRFSPHNQAEKYFWQYFRPCKTGVEPQDIGFMPLSLINGSLVDLLYFRYGEGYVYLHANPILFTNHYFVRDEGLQYVNACFSDFPGMRVYWDEASKTPVWARRHIPGPETHILQFILQHPGLRWAWYVFVTGLVIFILFRTRRTQRVIPLAEENRNKSGELINMVSTLYKQEGNHRQISNEIMRQWLTFLKAKYGIGIQLNKVEAYIPSLSSHSGFEPNQLRRIFKLGIQLGVSTEKDDARLMLFHNYLEDFYQNCK